MRNHVVTNYIGKFSQFEDVVEDREADTTNNKLSFIEIVGGKFR